MNIQDFKRLQEENRRVVTRSPLAPVHVRICGEWLGSFKLHYRSAQAIAWFWGRWYPAAPSPLDLAILRRMQ